RRHTPAADAALLDGVVAVLPEVRTTLWSSAGLGGQANPLKLLAFQLKLLPDLLKRFREPGGDGGVWWGLRPPPAVRSILSVILAEMDGMVKGQNGMGMALPAELLAGVTPVLGFSDAAGEAVARQRLKDYPE